MHVTACFKLIINSYLYLYFVLSSFLGDSWRVGLVAVNVAFEAVWTHCAFSPSPPRRWGFWCKPPHPILLVFCLRKFSSLSSIKDSFAGKSLSVGDYLFITRIFQHPPSQLAARFLLRSVLIGGVGTAF